MIKRIKNSLAIKIFFFTAILLSFVCGVTFLCISKMLPSTYTTMLSNDLSIKATTLTSQMSMAIQIKDCYSLVEEFEQEAEGKVRISAADGTVVYPEEREMPEDSKIASFMINTGIMAERVKEAEIQSAGMEFELLNGEEYHLTVIGDARQINQATEALMKTLPYIIIVIVALSFLCAAFYSWYITRPVIQLCHISRQIAALNFEHKYKGRRRDEIGILGDNLNELSENLSLSLLKLKTANAELKSDMEKERYLEQQRMDFFAAVSHELKTPITILKGHVNGMLDGVGNYKNHEHYLKRALETAEQMESLVGELLTISRIGGSSTSQMETVDLAELVREQLAGMMDLILEGEIQLEVFLPEHLCCSVDKVLMDKVFGNLLANGIRYTPVGGKVRVTMYAEDECVNCQVENTGVHIPEEALAHVFEPFYRVEQSRNRYTGGSGLGLYIVRTVLERHGASYHIKNTPDGVGFYFSVTRKDNSMENTHFLQTACTK